MKKKEKLNQIYFSICPVRAASHLAHNQGFFNRSFAKENLKFLHITTLPPNQRTVHYTHRHPHFIRDGGNIPPIWTKANGTDTVLVGTTFSHQRLFVLVARNSGITSIEQLRGKKIGLPRREEAIDFFRVGCHRMLLTALNSNQIQSNEVEWVDIPCVNYLSSESDNHSIWSSHKDPTRQYEQELSALLERKVDAIFLNGPRAIPAMKSNPIYSILELEGDHTLRANGGEPLVITASGELARKHPELIVKYLEASLKAAEWGQFHANEVDKIFAEKMFSTPEMIQASFIFPLHHSLEPSLSKAALEALEIQQKFMFDHHYIEKPVDIYRWADHSFIEAAKTRAKKQAA